MISWCYTLYTNPMLEIRLRIVFLLPDSIFGGWIGGTHSADTKPIRRIQLPTRESVDDNEIVLLPPYPKVKQ